MREELGSVSVSVSVRRTFRWTEKGLSLVGNEGICTLDRRVFWSFCRTDVGKRNFVVVDLLLLQQECSLC